VKIGATFDTGALISIERRKERARLVLDSLSEQAVTITVPLPVIGEWWRGRTDWRERILAAVEVEPLTLGMVKLAGEALASVTSPTGARRGQGPGFVDALVMASAASRGDIVYTGDIEDLERLAPFFPGVRILSL
jgi:predicted nucleic acid-binding protein